MTVVISDLFIYPVKSMAGIRVNEAQLTEFGFKGDREWMLVDDHGQFVSQRQLPQMATLQPMFDGTGLSLRNAQGDSIAVDNPLPDAATLTVKVWRDHCQAFVASAEVNAWLCDALASQRKLQLVKFDKRTLRPAQAQRFGEHHTHFADAAPYLVANHQSLNALNEKLKLIGEQPVSIRNFRANIVIDGIAPFAEHRFSTLNLHTDTVLRLVDHCQRCAIITVDPDTGVRHPSQQPFMTLAQCNAMPENPKAPAFGVNSVLLTGAGNILREGDVALLS